VPGFPIRTPWDHSLVDSSPRPIAASHVLHRLLVPRHPPFALDNLTTKMLASTVQFSTNDQPTTPSDNTNTTAHAVTGMLSRSCLAKKQPHKARGIRHQEPITVVPSGLNRVLIIVCQPHQTPVPPSRSTPERMGSCTRFAGRCQLITRQCLRHMSTPPPHTGDAGY
jgi:hypothetical protein